MDKTFLPAKNFEARAAIEDLAAFRKILKKTGARKIKESKFIDYIYVPSGKKWDLRKKNFKLRIFHKEKGGGIAEFVYHPSEFKEGIKKHLLFFDALVGNKKDAFKILNDWNFTELFHFGRHREVYEIRDQLVFLEKIERLGWLVEVEGDNFSEVKWLMRKLGIFKKRITKTIPELVQDSLTKKK